MYCFIFKLLIWLEYSSHVTVHNFCQKYSCLGLKLSLKWVKWFCAPLKFFKEFLVNSFKEPLKKLFILTAGDKIMDLKGKITSFITQWSFNAGHSSSSLALKAFTSEAFSRHSSAEQHTKRALVSHQRPLWSTDGKHTTRSIICYSRKEVLPEQMKPSLNQYKESSYTCNKTSEKKRT